MGGGGGVGGEAGLSVNSVFTFQPDKEGANNLVLCLELVVDENFHLWIYYALHCITSSLRRRGE